MQKPERHAPFTNRSRPSKRGHISAVSAKRGGKRKDEILVNVTYARTPAKQGQLPTCARDPSVVISFVGWREWFAGINFHPGLWHTCANRKSRQPACCRANFREPTYIPLSRVTEHGIQFVVVSPMGGREAKGFSPRRVTSPTDIARTHCGLKVTVIRSRCTAVMNGKRGWEMNLQSVKFKYRIVHKLWVQSVYIPQAIFCSNEKGINE